MIQFGPSWYLYYIFILIIILTTLSCKGLNMITLDQLSQKSRGLIQGFQTTDLAMRRKLLAMGVTPGCEVEVVRSAPFGDPIQIKLRGFQLCLRLREAAAILIEG